MVPLICQKPSPTGGVQSGGASTRSPRSGTGARAILALGAPDILCPRRPVTTPWGQTLLPHGREQILRHETRIILHLGARRSCPMGDEQPLVPKRCDGVVVGMIVRGDEAERYRIVGRT